MDIVRRDRPRPCYAELVVMLFDGRSHDPAGADPVAAHDERSLAAVLVEERGLERLGEAGLELEDVTDFDRHL